jgi:phosphinothricin acetyltransferase
MVIRKANPDDANALCRIYNHYVVHTAVTFETDPVSEAEMGQRVLEVQNENLPYFVLEVEGRVVELEMIQYLQERVAIQ